MKYVKLEYDRVVYYVQEQVVLKAVEEFQRAPGRFGEMKLMQFSDFVIDKRTNELKKCRAELERILDVFVDSMQPVKL